MLCRNDESELNVVKVSVRLTLILALIVGLVACESELDEYSDAFNPVFQKHLDLYTVEFGEVLSEAEEAGNVHSRSAKPNMAGGIAILNEMNKRLENIRYELAAVNWEWSLLYPPKEAQKFHELVLETMQVRLHAVQETLNAYTLLAAGQMELTMEGLEKAYALNDEGDRLFTKVLAEGRTLGNIEIIRE